MKNKPHNIDDLKPAEYNPRQIDGDSANGLRNSIERFGDLSGIVFNTRSGRLVAGHQRVDQLKSLGATLHRDESHLYIVHGRDKFRVREVDWDHTTEVQANITANNPHIAGVFTNDLDALLESLNESVPDDEFTGLRLDELMSEIESSASELAGGDSGSDIEYSKKIDGPVYEPRGDKPSVSTMFNTDRTKSLLSQIDRSYVSSEEKEYLKAAACRHTVFRYDLAAEYYAHASAEMQRLMEASALVIPDFDRALELGFVRLTKGLADLYEENKENESKNG